MKWESTELVEWLAKMDGKISDELRLVMLGFQHVDARVRSLQRIGLYANAALTVILLMLTFR